MVGVSSCICEIGRFTRSPRDPWRLGRRCFCSSERQQAVSVSRFSRLSFLSPESSNTCFQMSRYPGLRTSGSSGTGTSKDFSRKGSASPRTSLAPGNSLSSWWRAYEDVTMKVNAVRRGDGGRKRGNSSTSFSSSGDLRLGALLQSSKSTE